MLAVALNAEGTLALTGSEDRTARVWRVPGGEPVGDPLHHPGQVQAVAFRPDGRAVLTAATTASHGSGRSPRGAGRNLVPDGDIKAAFASPSPRRRTS